MFREYSNRYSSNIAIIDDKGVQVSYSQLSVYSSRLAQNIKKRSLVFSFCENSLGSLIGYYTFLDNGVVPLMLDAELEKNQAQELINLYQPNYIWIPESSEDKYTHSGKVFSDWGYCLLKINETKLSLDDSLSLLLTTSGSTGSPKLVRLSSDNILSNAQSISTYLEIKAEDRAVTSLPMNYSYGLSVVNSHLISGATILLTNFSVVQKEFWEFVKNEKATSIAGVPYTYQLFKMIRFFTMKLPDLKLLTQAGGKLNAQLVEEFSKYAHENQKKFIVMYGQTEATARMSYLPFGSALKKPASIGIPIPGGKFELRDINTADEILQPNLDGELIYYGKNVSLGYASCIDDLSKGDENNGVLRTGDIAKKDEDGFYFITGRIKRFIKIYGNRVNLDEVENLIKSVTSSEVACVGSDDKMIIYLTTDTESELILKFLSEKLKLNIRAFEIRTISTLPKNNSGKILYSSLKNN